jgi:hypothetical protein
MFRIKYNTFSKMRNLLISQKCYGKVLTLKKSLHRKTLNIKKVDKIYDVLVLVLALVLVLVLTLHFTALHGAALHCSALPRQGRE